MNESNPVPDFMTIEERAYYHDQVQMYWRRDMPSDLMGIAVAEHKSYGAIRSGFWNMFKRWAYLDTMKHFNAKERWTAAKVALRLKVGRPRGTAKYASDEERKEAHRQSVREYQHTDGFLLRRRFRAVQKTRSTREAGIQQLLREWEIEQNTLVDWKEIDRQQLVLLRECLAESSPAVALDTGLQRLSAQLGLTQADPDECKP